MFHNDSKIKQNSRASTEARKQSQRQLVITEWEKRKNAYSILQQFYYRCRNIWYKSIWPQEDEPQTLIVSQVGATGEKDVFLQRHPFPTAENPEITTKPVRGGLGRRVIPTQRGEHYTRWSKNTFFSQISLVSIVITTH